MAWSFGDSFDLYSSFSDLSAGYWDVAANGFTFAAGRFANSRSLSFNGNSPNMLVKSSGINDPVHHVVVSHQQSQVSGSINSVYYQFYDGATIQCTVLFRSDGVILLLSGGVAGTVLATYSGAVTVANTWYGFEFEVKIDGSAGSFAVRKNGNNVNDFTATSLNTRTSTNNYANKLAVGGSVSGGIDDLFWQSGAATGTWLGDVRCYTRMPASDASVTFSRPAAFPLTPYAGSNTGSDAGGVGRYLSFIGVSGSIASVIANVTTGFTGTCKLTIFADTGANAPGAVLSSANIVTNPVTGPNTFTFGTPLAITAGTKYWVGLNPSAAVVWTVTSTAIGLTGTGVSYASFPVASPAVSANGAVICTINVTGTLNAVFVNEAQQDGAATYVFDSNPGDADFYGIGSIASTPATVIATTLRGYMQKSDAGTRTAAAQLKSGATTVATPTLALSSSGFLWAWRTDLVDPNTGAAWTAAAVNNVQIGPVTIA